MEFSRWVQTTRVRNYDGRIDGFTHKGGTLLPSGTNVTAVTSNNHPNPIQLHVFQGALPLSQSF
jgi:hypothetical protein